jgi:hypothetical protein
MRHEISCDAVIRTVEQYFHGFIFSDSSPNVRIRAVSDNRAVHHSAFRSAGTSAVATVGAKEGHASFSRSVSLLRH